MIDPQARSRPAGRVMAGGRGRRGVLAAALGLTLVLAAACGSSKGGTTSPGAAGASTVDTLVMANAVAVDTLDPAQNSANESIWMDQNIYSRLVSPKADGTGLVPDLAKSWDISQDALTYTFHLRDAKFSDGSPVLASDVVYSIKRENALKDGWGFLMTAVKSVTAPDAKTVVIKLSKPHAPLLADLAMYAYSVLPEKLVKSGGAAFFNKPVGSGPFMVTSYNANAEVDFDVNPNWYGTKPKIKHLKIKIVTDDNTRLLALEAGTVDVVENPPGNMVDQINKNPKLQSDLFASTRVDFIMFSTKEKHFSDVRVRQAAAMAIDLKSMNKLAYQSTAVPATSFMPYKMEYWDDSLPQRAVNIAKAKSLLAEAGYPKGFSTNIITVSGDAAGQAQALVIKDDLAKIGISVKIDSYELATAYANEAKPGTFGMGERYWTNDIIDPDEVVTFAVDPSAGADAFHSSWSDPATVALVNKARSETDATQRAAMYKTIQQTVYDQVPFLPLAYAPYRYANGKWVTGFKASPLGNYNDSLLTLTVASH